MDLISEITNEPRQKHTLILPSGKQAVLTLEFKPMQTGWFMSLEYEDFSLKTLRLATSPNCLHQYKNLIPFGIGCFVDANQEPMFQDDFSSARALLYLLSEDEVNAFEDLLGEA